MELIKKHFNYIYIALVPILIISWILWMPSGTKNTQTYAATNLIMGLIGLTAYFFDKKTKGRITKKQNILISVFSINFASASLLGGLSWSANKNLLAVVCAFLGGFFAAYSVLHLILTADIKIKEHNLKFKPSTVFLFCFLSVALLDLIVMLLGFFPGVLTADSVFQVYQNISGNYRNDHPFYHTVIIGLFVKIGLTIFGNINIGIALFHIFQIFVISGIYAFTITTLYQKNSPLWVIVFGWLWYFIHPAMIMYSFTMWKDVLFAGAVLLFITSLSRIFFRIGKNQVINYILVFLSAFGFCLWRSNGLYAFILTSVLFSVVFAKKYKVLTVGFLAVALCSCILIGPTLRSKNIAPPDEIEHLSIPAQQVARVVYDGCELTKNEYEFLSNIIDVEKISQSYEWDCSNAIKNLVRASNGNDFISKNKGKVLKFWIALGIKHPKQYIAAWVDQTKGYYYSGHFYWIYDFNILENDLGIHQTNKLYSMRVNSVLYAQAFDYPDRFPVLNIFVSLGLMFWTMAGAFIVAMARCEKKTAFIFLPILLIIMSLLVATPVYSEFRYAFSLCVSMPIIGIMLCKYKTKDCP